MDFFISRPPTRDLVTKYMAERGVDLASRARRFSPSKLLDERGRLPYNDVLSARPCPPPRRLRPHRLDPRPSPSTGSAAGPPSSRRRDRRSASRGRASSTCSACSPSPCTRRRRARRRCSTRRTRCSTRPSTRCCRPSGCSTRPKWCPPRRRSTTLAVAAPSSADAVQVVADAAVAAVTGDAAGAPTTATSPVALLVPPVSAAEMPAPKLPWPLAAYDGALRARCRRRRRRA